MKKKHELLGFTLRVKESNVYATSLTFSRGSTV